MTVNLSQLATQRPDVVNAFLNSGGVSPWGSDLQSFANTWLDQFGRDKEGYTGYTPASPPPPPAVPPPPPAQNQALFNADLNAKDASGQKFDPVWYLQNNPDVAAAVGKNQMTALGHYQTFGAKEARKGSALDPNTSTFNEQSYDAANPDVAKAIAGGQFSSGLQHYLDFGSKESRDPTGGVASSTTTVPPPPPAVTTTTSTGQTASLLSPPEQENQDETAAAVARGKARNQMFASRLTGGNNATSTGSTSPFGGMFMTNPTRSSRLAYPGAFGGSYSTARSLW